MGYEHRNDSQQMDYRNDPKLACPYCNGTGKLWRLYTHGPRAELARECIGRCDECDGTGRRAQP